MVARLWSELGQGIPVGWGCLWFHDRENCVLGIKASGMGGNSSIFHGPVVVESKCPNIATALNAESGDSFPLQNNFA